MSTNWIPLPDVADLLGVDFRTVRNMVRSGELAAIKVDGFVGLRVPEEFLIQKDGRTTIIDGLAGSLTQLADGGLDTQEAVSWMLTHHEELGMTPAAALAAGGKHAVRRAAVVLD